jgi:hypothetical protein
MIRPSNHVDEMPYYEPNVVLSVFPLSLWLRPFPAIAAVAAGVVPMGEVAVSEPAFPVPLVGLRALAEVLVVVEPKPDLVPLPCPT